MRAAVRDECYATPNATAGCGLAPVTASATNRSYLVVKRGGV